MPQFGNDSDPTDGAEWWGSGVSNQHCTALTMPEDGTITQVGVYMAGKDASVSVKNVIWNSTRDSVLAQSSSYTATGHAFAIGNSDRHLANLVTPIFVAGGTTLYVGFTRNPTGAAQFDRDTVGSHYDDYNGSSNPSGMSGETLDSSYRFNAFCVYEVGAETYVRRSGAWVKSDKGIYVRRSAAWVAAGAEVYARRSGAWVKV